MKELNLERHIWEGWKVIDFIEALEPVFNQMLSNKNEFRPYEKLFENRQEIKKWCMDNQPYYKKYIPEVVTYFHNKIK
jgi:hypothetical protein